MPTPTTLAPPTGLVPSPEDVTAALRRVELRRARHQAQRYLWRTTQVRRVAYCGRVVADRAQGVAVRVTGTPGTPEARGGIGGLQTCGSVWSCPVCSEKINAARFSELLAAMERWQSEPARRVYLLTLTLSHTREDRLADLWDAISPAWQQVTSRSTAWRGGKRERGDVATFGIGGWTRLVEVKDGRNGWHPHIHALLFTDRPLDGDDQAQLRSRIFGRWSSALAKKGYRTLEFDYTGQEVGADIREVNSDTFMAEYFAKNGYYPAGSIKTTSAAFEVTGSHAKKQGKGGVSPFDYLAQCVARDEDLVDKTTGEIIDATGWDARERALARWHEWEQASRGRRQLTWSRGFKQLLGIDQVEDEEIVEANDLEGEPLSLIGATEWTAGRWAWRRLDLVEWVEAGTLAANLAAVRAQPRYRDALAAAGDAQAMRTRAGLTRRGRTAPRPPDG